MIYKGGMTRKRTESATNGHTVTVWDGSVETTQTARDKEILGPAMASVEKELDLIKETNSTVFCSNVVEEEDVGIQVWALSEHLKSQKFGFITTLVLDKCGLTDANMAPIVDCVKYTSHIEILDLRKNKFTSNGFDGLLTHLAGDENLRELNISDNVECSATLLEDMLEQNSDLKSLHVSGMGLGEDPVSLAKGLRSNSTLKCLDLEDSRFNSEKLKAFLEILGSEESDTALEKLVFNFNTDTLITDYRPIFTNPKLSCVKILHLGFISRDSVAKTFLRSLASMLSRCTNIKELYLPGNSFSDTSFSGIFAVLSANKSVELLDLSDNAFQAPGIDRLTSCVNTEPLQTLILKENPALYDAACVQKVVDFNGELKRRCAVASQRNSVILSNNTRSSTKRGSNSRDVDRKSDDSPGLRRADKPTRRQGRGIRKKRGKRNFQNKINRNNKKAAPAPGSGFPSDDDTVVVMNPPKEVVPPRPARARKGLRKFAQKKKLMKMKKPSASFVKPTADNKDVHDNLNNDYDSLVYGGEGMQVVIQNSRIVKSKPDKGAIAVVCEADDFHSVVFESDDEKPQPQFGDDSDFGDFKADKKKSTTSPQGENHNAARQLNNFRQQKRRAQKNKSEVTASTLLCKQYGDDDRVDELRSVSTPETQPPCQSWTKIRKSDQGFIDKVREYNRAKAVARNRIRVVEPKAVLDLSEEDVERLSAMLIDFENLLDREDYVRGTGGFTAKRTGRRRFAERLGVIGELKNQPKGQIINLPLAKSKIANDLMNRHLVRSVTLVKFFEKLRREIGSGVPSRVGGMLPSVMVDSLTGVSENGKPRLPDLSLLEDYVKSFLLIKVVIWSVLKALAYSDPTVDPCGRHLLEEFAKGLITRDDVTTGNSDNSPEAIERKKQQTGKIILEGAVFQLIDVLLLLKPMTAYGESLLLTVSTDNPQAPLEKYEHYEHQREIRTERKLKKQIGKVDQFNKRMATKRALLQMKDKGVRNSKQSKHSAASEKGPLRADTGQSTSTDGRKPKNIDRISRGLHKIKNQSLQRQKKKSSMPVKVSKPKKKVTEGRIHVKTKMIRYRNNCPERIISVLGELRYEAATMSQIMSVDNFLPFLFAFVDQKQVTKHIQERTKQLKKPTVVAAWFEQMNESFQNPVVAELPGLLMTEIEASFKQPKKQRDGNELGAVFARRKAKRTDTGSTIKEGDNSFFGTLVNSIFANTALSAGSISVIKNTVEQRLNDKATKGDREAVISHMTKLCTESSKPTAAGLMLKSIEMAQRELEDEL